MSLKVWLPLNGDLTNNGTSNANITVSGATVNTSGKIGSCYSFDGSDDYISIDCSDLYSIIKGGTQPFSMTFWIYHADSTRAIIFGDYGLTGAINFNVELTTGHAVRFYWGGSPDKNFTTTVAAAGWTHIALVYTGSAIYIYKDGVKQTDSYSGALAAKTKTTGVYYLGRDNRTGTTVLNGRLNDFRIYDHALSAKEVKEISQGLVLHYKLDNSYIESTTNLYSGTFSNTCYNGATNKYGYGTNTDIYKTTGKFQNKDSVKIYMGTAGLDAYPYVYFDAFNTVGTAIHTLSFDYYPTSQTSIIPYSYSGTYNISYITSNGDSNAVTNASSIIIPVLTNQWNHISITMQKYDTTNTTRGNGYIRIGSAKHTSTTTDYWLFANIQIEAKAYETGYIAPGTTRDDTLIQDSSGYNHNAISNGSQSLTISSDSPKYKYSVNFVSGARIATEYSSNFLPTDMITINIWFKSSNAVNRFLSCTEGGGFNFESGSGYVRFPLYISGKGYTACVSSTTTWSSLSDNQWHMITATYDRTQSKIYIDGNLDTTTDSSYPNVNIGYNASTPFTLGAEAQTIASPIAGTYVGNLSDCRIYCTALSANDVLDLYHTSMSIDKSKNIHTFELNENGSNKLTKTGILKDYMVEPFITLPDGSNWQLLLYHYVDGGANLFTQSNATFCNDFGLYSRLAYVNNFTYDNKYEFYVLQDDIEYRWTQTSQPTATSISGLTTVSGYNNPVNGLAKPTSLTQTYIGYNSWWGACGCWTSYSTGGKTGIPGFGAHSADGICTRYLALYARISEPKAEIANLNVYANNLIER